MDEGAGCAPGVSFSLSLSLSLFFFFFIDCCTERSIKSSLAAVFLGTFFRFFFQVSGPASAGRWLIFRAPPPPPPPPPSAKKKLKAKSKWEQSHKRVYRPANEKFYKVEFSFDYIESLESLHETERSETSDPVASSAETPDDVGGWFFLVSFFFLFIFFFSAAPFRGQHAS